MNEADRANSCRPVRLGAHDPDVPSRSQILQESCLHLLFAGSHDLEGPVDMALVAVQQITQER